ncbi:MAG: DUF370 domain-containing protein [Oscillospiraceae bacterium]|nr:DUF370 domain-containing protein [Oscillospiraceae bacterium]
MYLYLGGDLVIEDKSIIGIFDLDNTSWSHLTRKYLSMAEKAGIIKNTADDIPRSFVVCTDKNIVLTQPTAATLARRLNIQEKSNGRIQ